MDKKQIVKMFFSVIIPPILVVALFAIAVGAIIIPATEDALMQKKRDMIQAIVMSATSILERHAQMERDGLISAENSKKAALTEMRALRYGNTNKDYLWITDLEPNMVMHPYFPELEGKSLNQYTDSEGKLLFVEAAMIAKNDGEGYINYMWARQDDAKDIVPKLSYIRMFEPWGWVVGSGIYLDDVHTEIQSVSLRLLKISGGIGIIVILLLLFVIRRGWNSEKGKRLAEIEIIHSRERYQALAHASNDLILLTIQGVIAGANKKACEILGINEDEIISRKFSDFVDDPLGKEMIASIESGGPFTDLETVLHGKASPERILLKAEYAFVNESAAILYTGYSMQQAGDLVNTDVLHESLRKSNFGVLILENQNNGKIVSANPHALNLLMQNTEKSIVGKDFRSLFLEGDANRLFIQLHSEKTVENILLRYPIQNDEIGYLQGWAVLIEDTKESKGKVIIYLLDTTKSQRLYQANNQLLFELLSPETKVSQRSSSLDSSSLESSIQNQFLRTQVVLRQSVKMGIDAQRITASMVRTIDDMFAVAVNTTISKLGPPPCRYSLLSFGSIGRFEPTLNADQDTAIIYDSEENNPQHSEYFKRFGSMVTKICADAGIPPCIANNSASNPAWCMNIKAWEDQFSTWINTSLPEDLIHVNIFFDFRTIVGDDALSNELRHHIFNEVSKRSVFLFHLSQDTLSFRTPSVLFGRIRSDSRAENYINLKSTMLHFVNFARIYALKNDIHETNTIKRLNALEKGNHISTETIQDTIDAWKFLLKLRLKTQVSALEMNFAKENLLILEELSSSDEMLLKKAIGQINFLQKRLSSDFIRMG